MSEQEWMQVVIEAANAAHWVCHHQLVPFRRDKSGRVRAIVEPGTTPGFPDIVCVHAERREILFIELKRQDGALSARQKEWRDALQKTGARYYLWRPSDIKQVMRVLFGEGVDVL